MSFSSFVNRPFPTAQLQRGWNAVSPSLEVVTSCFLRDRLFQAGLGLGRSSFAVIFSAVWLFFHEAPLTSFFPPLKTIGSFLLLSFFWQKTSPFTQLVFWFAFLLFFYALNLVIAHFLCCVRLRLLCQEATLGKGC